METIIFFALLLLSSTLSAQETDHKFSLGINYGRSYFHYIQKDYGTGLRSANPANHNFVAGVQLAKQLNDKFYLRTGIDFTMYQQYYSTRLHWGAFEEAYPVLLVPVLAGIKTPGRLSFFAEGGFTLGFMPEQYTGGYEADFWDGAFHPITSGEIFRDYGSFFPLLTGNVGVEWKVKGPYSLAVGLGHSAGFKTISRYQIRYNDGSDMNDKAGEQYGKGSSSSLVFCFRRAL